MEDMAHNDSVVSGEFSLRSVNERLIIIQVLIAVFLCINSLLIKTFFSKSFFYTTMRYILFAVTLFSDTFILIVSDILFILSYFGLTMQVWLCVIIYIFVSLYVLVTPVTLTAMTLERYVAICMPLRHGELSSRRNTLHCVLIIHGLSSVSCIVIVSSFFESAPLSYYRQNMGCSMDIFLLKKWHNNLFSVIKQFYFLMMVICIVFSYVKIMKVALAASGENKKSTWKGLRTVILHSFQLLLCLIQLWCPFVEVALLQIDFKLFVNVRAFNYIIFFLAPKCLNPLIYGLRDEKFLHEILSAAFLKTNL